MNNFKKDDLLMIINEYQNYTNQFINISDEDIDNLYFQIAKNDNYKDDLLQQQRNVLNNIFDIHSNALLNKIKE